MKKIILTAFAAIALATSAHAGAYVGGYIQTMNDSEAVYLGDTYDTSRDFMDDLYLNITVGYKFDNGLRLEADVMDMAIAQKDQDFSDIFAVGGGVSMVKALYDINTMNGFTPYIGVGVSDIDYVSMNDVFSFGGAGIVGVSYAFSNKFSLDLQYARLMNYTSGGENVKSSYNGVNEINLGIRYRF